MDLRIMAPERFAAVMEFAIGVGVAARFLERLEYLSTYADGECMRPKQCRCIYSTSKLTRTRNSL